MKTLAESLFRASAAIRYVAVYRGGRLEMHERAELRAPSSGESDRYEEILVNPTLLVLARQRGEIDCGGLEYLVIRYGSFFQIVHPVGGGHLSVAVEPEANPLALIEVIRTLARDHGLLQ